MNDTQDFVNGVDFTGESYLTPALLNQLVTMGYPKAGKGLVIVTDDTALNTPDVPDPADNVRWKDYLWIRVPHSTATSTSPLIYAWNDNATEDTDLLHWVLLIADVSAFAADILALQNSVTSLEQQQENFTKTLNGDPTTGSAGVVSDTATALAASQSATSALQSKLDSSALDTEATKLFVANAEAAAQSSTRKAVKACMDVDIKNGLQAQIDAINTVLGVSPSGNFVSVMETSTTGSNSAASLTTNTAYAAGKMKRLLNTISPGTSTLVTLSDNSVTVKTAGTYVVFFTGMVYITTDGGTGKTRGWQHILLQNSTEVAVTNSVLWNQDGNHSAWMNTEASGMAVLTLAENDVLTLYSYIRKVAKDVCNGGLAANCGNPYECYARVTLMKLA